MIYTHPTTEDNITGYRYSDLSSGQVLDQLMLTPEFATGVVKPRVASQKIVTRPMLWDKHLGNSHMRALFGDTVLAVPMGGIKITFPIPILRIHMYIASDVINNTRRSNMWCYDEDGVFRGGDLNMGPYGPCPDYPTLPEGADPRTTAWQYPVYDVAYNLPPPYGDGEMQPPCKFMEFDPGGDDVFLGLIQAVTKEQG